MQMHLKFTQKNTNRNLKQKIIITLFEEAKRSKKKQTKLHSAKLNIHLKKRINTVVDVQTSSWSVFRNAGWKKMSRNMMQA